MLPPAPINPQIKPINTPQKMDSTALRPVLLAESAAFVVITGLTINLTPSNVVIKTEKPPIVLFGTREAI